MQRDREERSLGELFAELSRETSTLVKQEIDLAKVEMKQKGTRAASHAGYVGAGGALAYAGLLAVLGGLVALLSLAMPVWVAALLVGLVVIGAGYALIRKGLDGLKQMDPTPQRTVETLKEDVAWAKDQMS